jgi:chromosome segregation ATPase
VPIDKQDPVQRMGDELTGLWRQVGELVRGQSRIEGRLDRIETDVAVLKTDVRELKGDVRELKGDVGGLKGDVRELKGDVRELKGDVGGLKTGLAANTERLDRLELSTERRFNRIDAQLERLLALVLRAEAKGC